MTDVDRLERDLAEACWSIALYWNASLHGKRETPGVGFVTGGAEDGRPPVSVATLDVRAEANSRLAAWSLLVLEERELQTHLDGFNAVALARFVSTHAQWLASHEAGSEAARELVDSARKVTRLAKPERRDYVVIGECPRTVASPDGDAVACGFKVRAYPEKNIIKCPGCDHEDTLAWWESQIVPNLVDLPLLTAAELLVFLHQETGRQVPEGTIRQWASSGAIRRHGKDRRGRTLYDKAAVLGWVKERTKERDPGKAA